jgi:hypothetical protein
MLVVRCAYGETETSMDRSRPGRTTSMMNEADSQSDGGQSWRWRKGRNLLIP